MWERTIQRNNYPFTDPYLTMDSLKAILRYAFEIVNSKGFKKIESWLWWYKNVYSSDKNLLLATEFKI